jgi:c-di-GMP-binding flagellar brake protein YcgR
VQKIDTRAIPKPFPYVLIDIECRGMIAAEVSGVTPPDAERRRYPRMKAKVPVELKCAGIAPLRTSTDEISLCACYIETMFTLDVGMKLELIFSLEGARIGARAIVATKYRQVGNGIDFVEMAPEDRLRLSDFISSLG